MSDVYTKLRQRLEEFAIPSLPGKGILEFLRILFTEKEAEMLSKFKSFNRLFTIEEFARKNGYNLGDVQEVFYNLARRNLIRYDRNAGKDYFRLQPLVVGIHEAFFSTWRAQNPDTLIPAAKAIDKYFKETFHKVASNSKSPWARIIPSVGAIDAILSKNPEYYPIDEIEITSTDKIRRIGAIIKYGTRSIIKKLFSGKIGEIINALKSEVPSIIDRRKTSLFGLRKKRQRKKKIANYNGQKTLKINKKIPATMRIHPYEVIRHYIEQATTISVTPCPCRKKNRLLDETRGETQKVRCKSPLEDTCLHLRYDDQVANEYNLRGGHIISKEDALDILNRCEEAGLVHTSYNSREKIEFICNCCPCCCDILGTMTKYHQKLRSFVESNFQPTHHKPNCIKCGKCMKICPVHAISQDEEKLPIIDLETCIGCGVCVSNCSKNALQLIKVKNQRPAIDAIEAYMNFANQKVG